MGDARIYTSIDDARMAGNNKLFHQQYQQCLGSSNNNISNARAGFFQHKDIEVILNGLPTAKISG